MTNTYKNAGIGIGGILVGALMIFSFQANGQTITVSDAGVRPIDIQKVTITKIETQEVTSQIFDGTLSDLKNEELPRAIIARDAAIANVERIQALITTVQTELDKLPARSNANDEVVTPE